MNPSVQKYRIIERIGGGGMGIVYKAFDDANGRFVALKLIRQHLLFEEEIKKRFILEGNAVSMLEHPNICKVFEVNQTEDGQLYIAMELYEGETLKTKINSNSINLNESISLLAQIVKGLKFAHQNGIIHRDINPSNIFITNDNDVKILDFGLAKLANNSKFTQITQTFSPKGTINYMSPEQSLSQSIDYRSDIWSVGILIYEMITARKPFDSEFDQATIYSILNDPYPDIPKNNNGSSIFINYIIDKCLRKNPDERYQSLDELESDLNKCQSFEKLSLLKKIEIFKNRHLNKIKNYSKYSLSALLLVFLIFILNYENTNQIKKPLTVAVASASNKSKIDSLDYISVIISDLLITHLEQSNKLQVVTIERMQDLAAQYGMGNEISMDSSAAVKVCRKAQISAIIIPYYYAEEEKIITGVNVINLDDSLQVLHASALGLGLESIFRQVGEICNQLGDKLHQYFKNSSLEKIDISKVTTRSIEAYRYFLRGRDYRRTIDWNRAKEMFIKAIKIDSTFAIAYSWLAVCYDYLDLIELSRLSHAKALEFASFATRKEKLMIEAFYSSSYENNFNKAAIITEQLVKEYPIDKEYRSLLGFYYSKIGRKKEALQQYKIALELDPNQVNLLNFIGYMYIENADYDEAKKYLKKYSELIPGSAGAYDSFGDLFFHQGNLDSAEIFYRKAFEVDNLYGTQLKLAYISARKNEFEKAFKWIDNLTQLNNCNISEGSILNWRSFYKYLTMQKAQAMKDILNALKFYSEQKNFIKLAQTYSILAWNLVEDSRFEEGKKYMLRYYEIYSKRSESAENLARIDTTLYHAWLNLKLNQPDSLISTLKSVKNSIDQLPASNSFHRERFMFLYQILEGEYYIQKRMYSKVISLMMINYKPETNFHEILIRHNLPFEIDTKARAFILLNRNKEAIEEYKKLCSPDLEEYNLRITNPIYHFRLAQLFEKEGMNDEAYKEYLLFSNTCKYDHSNEYFLQSEKRISELSN